MDVETRRLNVSRFVISLLLAIATFVVSQGARAEPTTTPRAAFPLTEETSPPRVAAPPPSAAPSNDVRPPATAYGAQDIRWSAPETSRPEPPTTRDAGDARNRRRVSDDWMLSLEAVTHAPLDIGFQLGFEAKPGLRLSGGYGRVPGGYLGLVTHAAGTASGADPLATALISDGFQGGYTWRVQGGIRPFPKLGLYLDAGYSRVALAGSLDSSAVPAANAIGVQGGYKVDAILHMWLLELGYQAHIGDHIVLAVGAGVMGTFSAHTSITRQAGSVLLPPVDPSTPSTVDDLLVKHGYLPTLTLRLGFDLI